MAELERLTRLFRECLRGGWHAVEDNGRTAWAWSEGRAEIEAPPGTVFLDLEMHSMYFAWTGRPQSVRVLVDGRLRGEHKVRNERHCIQVACEGGARRVVLECDALRPRDVDEGNNDSRVLGVCLSGMVPVTKETTLEEYFGQSLGYLDSSPELKRRYYYTLIGKEDEGEFLHGKIAEIRGERLPSDPRGFRVLDCGAGTAGATVALARHGVRAVALDLSHWCLGAARVNAFLSGISFDLLRGDAQSLCFGDETFDVVLGLDIIEHVPDPGRMLREIRRVLKKDGLFIFRTGFGLNPSNIRRDPHYQTPFSVLLPRPIRAFYLSKVLGKAKECELEDFVWFKTFGALRRFAGRCGLTTDLLEPDKMDESLAAAKRTRGPATWPLRAMAAILPRRCAQGVHATCTDAYCVARRRD